MLTIEATPSANELRADHNTKTPFTLSNIRITENDQFLTNKLVTGALSWGDGSLPFDLVQAPTTSPLIIPQLSTSFSPGFYTIVITAENFRAPTHDTAQKVILLNVIGETKPTEELGQIISPILPRDVGFPNAAQWNLDIGQDLLVLESSVRMLLLTSKGERLMEPEYGTNLFNVVFEPDTAALQSLIQDDIVRALSQWEPRVEVTEISVSRGEGLRKAVVQAKFNSRLHSQSFQVNFQFER